MRKSYLDNVRWITIVLVVIYHVIYMYNGVVTAGVLGPFSDKVQYQDAFQYVVYPWFMLLLFVVSGMCARYYLEGHSHKEFIKTRTDKLLVPSTIGLFVFQWIMGYYNMQIAGAFEQMSLVPKPVLFLIMCVSGTGPLWFIQLLWFFSLLLVLVRKIEKDRLYSICGKANVVILILLALAIWGAAQILNTPIVVVYRFGIYGLSFFIGYFVLSHDEVVDRLSKWWLPLMISALVCMVAFVVIYWQQPYADQVVLKTFLCNVYAWLAILAILAFMNKYGNFENGFSRFMNRQSWGLYIFHYLGVAVCAYYLHLYVPGLPVLLVYILTAIAAFGGAFLLNIVISKIPVIRWCVLGIRRKKEK